MIGDDHGAISLRSVLRAALTLTGAAVATQALGIVRELFLAAQVGASADLDALLIAILLPTTLAGVIASGTRIALVPAYLEARTSGGAGDARRLAGTVLAAIGVAGLLLSILLEAFAGAFVAIAGPGLSEASRQGAIAYLHLLAPVGFTLAVTAVMFAVLQAEERFASIAIASLVGIATTLVLLLLLYDQIGLWSLAIGSLVGPLVNLGILIGAAMWSSLMPLPVPRWDDRLRSVARHAAPLTVSFAILQVNVIGDRAIASLIGPGAISTLRYADVLVRTPIGAIGPAWGSAIYPALVRSTLGGVAASLAATTGRALIYVLIVFVPVALLTAAVAPLAVSIAYGRGAFSAADVALTAASVAAFAPLLVTVMMGPVLTGANNARRRGALLLVGGTINVIVNISLDLLLGRLLGVPGIALASSIAESTVVIYFLYRLARSSDHLPIHPLAMTFGRSFVATVPVASVIALMTWTGHVPHDLVPGLLTLVAFGLAGSIGYAAIATWIGLKEPRAIVGMVWQRLRRAPGPA